MERSKALKEADIRRKSSRKLLNDDDTIFDPEGALMDVRTGDTPKDVPAANLLLIKLAIFFLLGLAQTSTFANTDQDCLNHLGGAFANVECFNELSLGLIKENEVISNKIISTIPKNNKNYNIFRQYIRIQKDLKKYCELSRDAMNSWNTEKRTTTNPRYYDYDAAYYQCVYYTLSNENIFLKTLLNAYGSGE